MSQTIQTITQGRPRSSYFVAFRPPQIKVAIDEEIVCHNPRTQVRTKAVCVEHFTYLWSDIPDSFCILQYGSIASELRTAFEKKYPESKQAVSVQFLLLKEIK